MSSGPAPKGSGSNKKAAKKTTQAVDWSRTTPDRWRKAVEKWPWHSLGNDEWEKSGACPRCGHEMEVLKQGLAISNFTTDARSALLLIRTLESGRWHAASGLGLYARCTCGENHPGRPPSMKRGCGQWCMLKPPPDRA
jgi:hypothetical protein